jgi:hypothetical protein
MVEALEKGRHNLPKQLKGRSEQVLISYRNARPLLSHCASIYYKKLVKVKFLQGPLSTNLLEDLNSMFLSPFSWASIGWSYSCLVNPFKECGQGGRDT